MFRFIIILIFDQRKTNLHGIQTVTLVLYIEVTDVLLIHRQRIAFLANFIIPKNVYQKKNLQEI